MCSSTAVLSWGVQVPLCTSPGYATGALGSRSGGPGFDPRGIFRPLVSKRADKKEANFEDSLYFIFLTITISCPFSQFQQHLTCPFYVPKCFTQLSLITLHTLQHFSFVIFGTKISAQNACVKCWWNWLLILSSISGDLSRC